LFVSDHGQKAKSNFMPSKFKGLTVRWINDV